MKLAISSTGNTLESPFSPRFGRADFMILIDSETREWEALPNPGTSAGGGAGPLAVQFVSEHGAAAVISGRFGPNAYGALEAAGIQTFLAKEGTVAQVFEQYLAGDLEQVNSATGPEMHGGGHYR